MSAFDKIMAGMKDVEAYLAGERQGYRVTVPLAVDVKSIRQRLKMTQATFSSTFGFSLDAVKHWEGGRRVPEAAARAYLTVIDKAPDTVFSVLRPEVPGKASRRPASKRSIKPAATRKAS